MSKRGRAISAGLVAAMLWSSPVGAFEFLDRLFGGGEEDDRTLGIIDPRTYSITRFNIEGGDPAVRSSIRNASTLRVDEDRPASGAAGLITTAQADYRSILAALYSQGYYGGSISILINGQEASSLTPATELNDPIQVDVTVFTGPAYRFGETEIVNRPPRPAMLDQTNEEQLARDAFRRGEPARAGEVDAAGARAVEDWRAAGHPTASIASRTAVADHANRTLDVSIVLDPGPQARFGETEVTGATRVDPDFIRYMTDIPPGRRFDPAELETAERRLIDLSVFSAVRVEEGAEVAADGTVPVNVEVIPRRPRRYGFGATFSSVDGLGLEAFWLHRNLFGRAERLRFDASLSGIETAQDPADWDYSLGASYTKPGVFDPDTDFVSSAEIRREVFDDYTENAVDLSFGFERRFSDRLTGSAYLEMTFSEVRDDTGRRELLTFGLPVALEYDNRNEPFDATRGYYLRGEVKPIYEAAFNETALRNEFEGRTYLTFADQRATLALRAVYGTVLGGTLEDLPPGDLFFAGGGGSIRGYSFRSIGVEVGDDTLGGRSVLEGSVELRGRFTERFRSRRRFF